MVRSTQALLDHGDRTSTSGSSSGTAGRLGPAAARRRLTAAPPPPQMHPVVEEPSDISEGGSGASSGDEEGLGYGHHEYDNITTDEPPSPHEGERSLAHPRTSLGCCP